MFRKLNFTFSVTFRYLAIISCFGISCYVDTAAIVGSPANYQIDFHLVQQRTQNQTEAKPDLSQQLSEHKPLFVANSSHTSTNKQGNLNDDRTSRQEVGEIVGDRVGTILSGVLGGGLSNIFEGSTSFIQNVNAQEEVDFVLNNVAPPFQTVLEHGFQGIKNYLGIGQSTTPRPVTVVLTQPPEKKIYLQPVVYENGTVAYIPIYHTVTKPPIVVTIPPEPSAGEDDNELSDIDSNNDSESDVDIYKKYPHLINSRVDRFH